MVDKKLKILQIGAGSMGTRRMRDLSTRNDVELALFDLRDDRRSRANKRFGIKTFESINDAMYWEPDALVISTPPDQHNKYIELALEKGLHSFCEASIWTYDFNKIESVSKEKNIVIITSSSLIYLPVVKEIKRIVEEELGNLHSYGMCLSTYLPTWHPDEKKEYYARNRSTSAGREMVPFELGYLNYIFGYPEYIAGYLGRRGELEEEFEDTLSLKMKLNNGAVAQLTIMTACPVIVRKGWAAGNYGYMEYDIITGEIYKNLPNKGINERIYCPGQRDGLERAYSEDIYSFVDKIKGIDSEVYSYRMSAIATGTLAALEKSVISGKFEKVDPMNQPALLPDMY